MKRLIFLGPPQDFPSDDRVGVTAFLKRSDRCSDFEQAVLAASKGAKFVVVQLDESTQDQDLVLAHKEENGEDQDKLSVPVISVSYETGEKVSRSILFSRRREALDVGEAFGRPIEEDGVLTLGQEPDVPWGDFDPIQVSPRTLKLRSTF